MPPHVVEIPGTALPLTIYETLSTYLLLNNATGYWGPVSSSIDWCERNYDVTFYIAEFWNTISNALLIIVGIVGIYLMRKHKMDTRFYFIYGGTALLGVGSCAFHATLTHIGQQGDETPMIFTINTWLWSLMAADPKFERAHRLFCKFSATFLVLTSVLFAVVHFEVSFVTLFQSLFGSSIAATFIFVLRGLATVTDPVSRRFAITYMISFLAATAPWLADQFFCDHLYTLPFGIPNPQCHAWWHVGTGVASCYGAAFICSQRLLLKGRKFRVEWWFCGLVPFVLPADSPSTKVVVAKR